jgi:hypothetical protein
MVAQDAASLVRGCGDAGTPARPACASGLDSIPVELILRRRGRWVALLRVRHSAHA